MRDDVNTFTDISRFWASKLLLKKKDFCANIGIHERLVQPVERHVDIVEVVGSSPISLTITKKILRHRSGDFFDFIIIEH